MWFCRRFEREGGGILCFGRVGRGLWKFYLGFEGEFLVGDVFVKRIWVYLGFGFVKVFFILGGWMGIGFYGFDFWFCFEVLI